MSHSETQLESRTVFEGRVITVTLDKVRLENGAESTAGSHRPPSSR